MFIKKVSLPRRTVLRGMGVTVALPLLEAMLPALTASAQTAANPRQRFGAVFVPHGERPGYWTPAKTGADFELTPILKPLEPFRDSLTVVSELCTPADGHGTTVAAWLTGSVPKKTMAEDVRAGVSVDQVIAGQIGQSAVFPSLELATEDFTGYIGACDGFYACAYMNTLSWRTATEPLPMEINPRVLFERMFGGGATNLGRLERMRRDRSILDSVAEAVERLRSALGPRDRSRLGDYLEDIREIERRIQRAEKQASTEVTLPNAPIGIPESFEEHTTLQFDLLALAFATDMTRVFTFMMSRDTSQRVYANLGITEPHHSLSHHGNNPESIVNLVKLNTYHVELFGRFLQKLRATPDGEGSLLDHSLLLFGSGMSESDVHSRINVPTLLAGRGAGLIRGNRHIQTPKETPIANLVLTLANKFGAGMDQYGISTGTLDL
ncbi:MAG: hypothetical protein C5B57_07560 [Blastocatellia bacterium]|nr:MAG: hypothetical protein C5B57_07560 [Blastocatellia bacterium]